MPPTVCRWTCAETCGLLLGGSFYEPGQFITRVRRGKLTLQGESISLGHYSILNKS
jgi:hypothetical protein